MRWATVHLVVAALGAVGLAYGFGRFHGRTHYESTDGVEATIRRIDLETRISRLESQMQLEREAAVDAIKRIAIMAEASRAYRSEARAQQVAYGLGLRVIDELQALITLKYFGTGLPSAFRDDWYQKRRAFELLASRAEHDAYVETSAWEHRAMAAQIYASCEDCAALDLAEYGRREYEQFLGLRPPGR